MTALWAGLVCGVLGLLVPSLVRRIPEPRPETDPSAPAVTPEAVVATEGHTQDESSTELSLEPAADPTEAEAPKELYADIAARPGLARWTAAASAGAGALLGWSLGADWALLFLVPLVPVLVALAVVDWRTKLLPTWVIARTYAALVPLVLLVGLVSGEWDDVVRAFWGWLITGGLYFVLWFVNSSGLGYGDVRLSGVIGICLGHLGWGELLAGVYSAFILGGVLGALLALAKVVDRRGVPFGPFMVAGALLGVLLGPWTAARLG